MGINNTPSLLAQQFHILFQNHTAELLQMLHQLFMAYNRGGSVVCSMRFHPQCHVLTPCTHTHSLLTANGIWNNSQISTKQGCDVSSVRHINIFSSKSPHHLIHPVTTTRSLVSEAEASKAHFFLQGKMCHSPQYYWSEGNGGRHGCQNVERLGWRVG